MSLAALLLLLFLQLIWVGLMGLAQIAIWALQVLVPLLRGAWRLLRELDAALAEYEQRKGWF